MLLPEAGSPKSQRMPVSGTLEAAQPGNVMAEVDGALKLAVIQEMPLVEVPAVTVGSGGGGKRKLFT